MFWIGSMFKKKSKQNMVFKIVITHKAQIDINEGIEWYDEQVPELGKRFFQTIQANFKTLCIDPF